jgi:uncharacterized protein with NAD-binding domain and iron-sulfur cluster
MSQVFNSPESSIISRRTLLKLFSSCFGKLMVMLMELCAPCDRKSKKLNVADPFAVCRFWFDRDFDWTHSHFTSLSGYQLTDSITLYHRIQSRQRLNSLAINLAFIRILIENPVANEQSGFLIDTDTIRK